MTNKIKKYKFYIFIMFFVTIFILFVFNNISVNYNMEKDNDSIRVFRSYSLEKDNGWYYSIYNERIETKSNQYKYITYFDGCNLKYEMFDDNYVPVINEDTNVIDYKIPVIPPRLSNSYKSIDNTKTEQTEITEINKLLNKIKNDQSINFEDLKSLNLINFQKQDIIKLWNNVIEKNYNNDFGKYSNLDSCVFVKEEKNDKYFQIGVMLSYGYIDQIKIDYYDGSYLSDLVNDSNANEEQIKLFNDIKQIETIVLNEGSFEIDSKYNDLFPNNKYKPILELLKKIEGQYKVQ